MSYLSRLLAQSAPLTSAEVHDLKDWYQALEQDCWWFGETPSDTEKMAAIRRRIDGTKPPTPPRSDEGTWDEGGKR